MRINLPPTCYRGHIVHDVTGEIMWLVLLCPFESGGVFNITQARANKQG